MTYGLSAKGKRAEVSEAIATSNLPDSAKVFTANVVADLVGTDDDKVVKVSVNGHDDGKSFSGSFNIATEIDAAELETSDAKVAAGEQAKEA